MPPRSLGQKHRYHKKVPADWATGGFGTSRRDIPEAQRLACRRCSAEDSCSWPWAGGAPCNNVACQGHPDTSAVLKLEGSQLAPPPLPPHAHTPHQSWLPQCHQAGEGCREERLIHRPSPYTHMHTHTDVHACPAAEASLAWRPPLGPVASRPPSPRPPPPTACLPAATFAQLCLVFSCLPSLLGGVGGGALSTACTWASARGKPAKQPPRPPSDWEGKGQAQAAQIPGRSWHGVGGSQTGTHTH